MKIAPPPHDASSGPKSWKVTAPVGATPATPVSVAASVSVPESSAIGAEARVVIVGVALATARVSFGALQAPATGVLLTSPPNAARQRYTPAAVGVASPDCTVSVVPARLSSPDWIAENTAGPAQVASSGPKSSNVTFAPAEPLTSPLTVASSDSVAPRVMSGEATVAITGVLRATARVSVGSLQSLVAKRLLSSPL